VISNEASAALKTSSGRSPAATTRRAVWRYSTCVGPVRRFTTGSILVRQMRSSDCLGTRAIPATTRKTSSANSKLFMITLLVFQDAAQS
jgi:hypothetical protein